MSAVSSTSVQPVKALTPLPLLKVKKEVASQLVLETFRSQKDRHSATLAMNGYEMQAMRSSRMLEPLVEEAAQAPHMNGCAELTESAAVNKLTAKRGFILCANKVHLKCLKFWMSLAENLEQDKDFPTQPTINAMIALSEELIKWLQSSVPEQKIYGDDKRCLTSAVVRLDGRAPVNPREYTKQISILRSVGEEAAQEFIKTQIAEYDLLDQNFFVVGYFEGDPEKKEYRIKLKSIQFEPKTVAQDPKYAYQGLVESELIPIPQKIAAAIETHERKTEKFKKELAAEIKIIELTVKRLGEWLALKNEIAAHLLPERPAITVVPLPSYSAAMAVQKCKKVKGEAIAEPLIPAEEPKIKPRVYEKTQVVLNDFDAFSTYQTLIGAENQKINWNQVIVCMQALGFEVTQTTSGGNTWKFKWHGQAWLRDEKTFDELADEFEPVESISATRALHEPHHGSLSKRNPLDSGRLSTFRKLLEECLFEQKSVTFCKKS